MTIPDEFSQQLRRADISNESYRQDMNLRFESSDDSEGSATTRSDGRVIFSLRVVMIQRGLQPQFRLYLV